MDSLRFHWILANFIKVNIEFNPVIGHDNEVDQLRNLVFDFMRCKALCDNDPATRDATQTYNDEVTERDWITR